MTDEAKRIEINQAIEYLREDACVSCIFNSFIGECTSVSDCYARKIADLIESLSAELEATEAIAALARGLEVERDQLKARLEHVEYERDAAVEDVSGYCATCAFVDDCAKHDLNDSAPYCRWFYGDCEDWQWRGPQEVPHD